MRCPRGLGSWEVPSYSVGEEGAPLADRLAEAHLAHGQHLPEADGGGHLFQIRDLTRTNQVWKGVFAQLRDDAPHVVAGDGQERELDLQDGDRLVEKCHFLYFAATNVLVWQNIRGLGGATSLEIYLGRALNTVVQVVQVQNEAELDRVLSGQIYELHFGYVRPHALESRAPQWNRHAFGMMESVHAARAKFSLRAPRQGSLGSAAKQWIRHLVRDQGFEKVRVKMTDDSNMVELFMAPLKDRINVELHGRYPVPARVFEALNEAHDRQRDSIPGAS